jgi:hypothetical protein
MHAVAYVWPITDAFFATGIPLGEQGRWGSVMTTGLSTRCRELSLAGSGQVPSKTTGTAYSHRMAALSMPTDGPTSQRLDPSLRVRLSIICVASEGAYVPSILMRSPSRSMSSAHFRFGIVRAIAPRGTNLRKPMSERPPKGFADVESAGKNKAGRPAPDGERRSAVNERLQHTCPRREKTRDCIN